jgi:hypothetical protein
MISFNNLPFKAYIRKQREYGLDQKTLFAQLKEGKAPLNFDADNKKIAMGIARNLLKRFGVRKNYQIYFRKSSSRRGYHFIVLKKGKQLFLKIRGVIIIRNQIGDCYGRLECDRLRARYTDLPISILFHHKNSRDATAFRELRYISQIK